MMKNDERINWTMRAEIIACNLILKGHRFTLARNLYSTHSSSANQPHRHRRQQTLNIWLFLTCFLWARARVCVCALNTWAHDAVWQRFGFNPLKYGDGGGGDGIIQIIYFITWEFNHRGIASSICRMDAAHGMMRDRCHLTTPRLPLCPPLNVTMRI